MELSSQSVFFISSIMASTCFLSRVVLAKFGRPFRVAFVVGLFLSAFVVFSSVFGLKEAVAVLILGLFMAAVVNALALNMDMIHRDHRPRDGRRMLS